MPLPKSGSSSGSPRTPPRTSNSPSLAPLLENDQYLDADEERSVRRRSRAASRAVQLFLDWREIPRAARIVQLWAAGTVAGIVVVILLLLSQVVGSLLPPGPPPPASGQPATHEPGFSHAICTKKSIDWRKISLKTVTAQPIAGLLENLRGESKFEASDVAVVGENIYVAFDNLESYGIFHKRLNHMSKRNRLVGHMGDESQYEGFTYRSKTGTFLATVEAEEDKNNNTTNDDDNHNNSSIRNKDGHQHAPPTYFIPAVHEVRLVHNDEHPENDSVEFIRECRVDFRLKRKNKGFEALEYHLDEAGQEWYLAVCEGNDCVLDDDSEDESQYQYHRGSGHGVLVLLQEDPSSDGGSGYDCQFRTVKRIPLPPRAHFLDYSALTLYPVPMNKERRAGRYGRLAVASQENAAMWIGDFDFERVEFAGPGLVLHFPRSDNCLIEYCNVEGIAFLDEYRIVAVSDASKRRQPHYCKKMAESIALLVLPERYERLEGKGTA